MHSTDPTAPTTAPTTASNVAAPEPADEAISQSPAAPDGPSLDDLGLAGALQTEVNRLAWHLRRPATSSGVTPTQLAALGALAKHAEGIRQGDLAALMGVTAPSTTRLIDSMIKGDMVTRERDATDARAYLVRIAPGGERTLANVRSAGTKDLRDDIVNLTVAQRAALESAIPVLRALADARLNGPARSAADED